MSDHFGTLCIKGLTDTAFISKQTSSHELCTYNIFDYYFYLRRIVTSKEHKQRAMVPPLFQEAICRDLAFSRVLFFFEIKICNRLCFERYRVNFPTVAAIHSTNCPFSIIREKLKPQILSNLLYFFKTGRVVARRYHN